MLPHALQIHLKKEVSIGERVGKKFETISIIHMYEINYVKQKQ